MKKRLCTWMLLIVMFSVLVLPAAAEEPELGYVTDQAGILSTDEWIELTARAEDLADNYEVGVYLIIVDDYSSFGDSMQDAAKNIHMDYHLGYGEGKDTFQLLMSMSDRKYWLLGYGDFANTALTDWGRDKMADDFLPYFADDDWFGGFLSYYDTSEDYLSAAWGGEPFDKNTDPGEKNNPMFSYGIALIVGVIVAAIVCTIFKGQMNTAVKQTDASEYIMDGGVKIRNRSDLYTHTTTTRTKIVHESDSSSGGGGGTSVDSDGYSGSGGDF